MNNYHPQIAPAAGNGAGWIQDILFDGVLWHDMTRSDTSWHTECLQFAGGTRVTFRNNVWRNCAVFDLSLTQYSGSGSPTSFTIENNFFGTAASGGYYSFDTNAWRYGLSFRGEIQRMEGRDVLHLGYQRRNPRFRPALEYRARSSSKVGSLGYRKGKSSNFPAARYRRGNENVAAGCRRRPVEWPASYHDDDSGRDPAHNDYSG
jgi:hypothetical protein